MASFAHGGHVTVERLAGGALARETWNFQYRELGGANGGAQLILQSYIRAERSSKRHGFLSVVVANEWNDRTATIGITEAPLPEDVVAEAKQLFTLSVQVEARAPRGEAS